VSKKITASTKADPKRNPYVAGMRFRKSGTHLDKRKEADRKACRSWKPEQ